MAEAKRDPAYAITLEELEAIGVILNDGQERGWVRNLAFVLKKKDPSVISKWKKELHRISSDDVQHMRLLAMLKEAGVLQAGLIAARVQVSSEQRKDEKGRGVRRSAREEIALALGKEGQG